MFGPTFLITSIMLFPMVFISRPALAHPSGPGKSGLQHGWDPVFYSEPYPGLATEATYSHEMNHRQPPKNTELYINPSLLELNHESAVAPIPDPVEEMCPLFSSAI